MNLHNISVFSNSLINVLALKGELQAVENICLIHNDISNLCQERALTGVFHAPRHLNVVAHELTKFGRQGSSSLWLSNFPSWLAKLFQSLPKIIRDLYPSVVAPVANCDV